MTEDKSREALFAEWYHANPAAYAYALYQLEAAYNGGYQARGEHDAALLKMAVEALEDAKEHIQGEIDVVDGTYGEPHPNKAMQLDSIIEKAIKAIKGAM